MKILQLISSYGLFGAENVVIELSTQLNLYNITSIVGTFDNSQNSHIEVADRAKECNLKTCIFPCKGKIDIKTVLLIMNFVKTNNIDIIHSHGYKSNIYGFIVAKIMRKPIVSTCHNWIADDVITRTYYQLDKSILPFFDKIIAVSDLVEAELLRIKVKKIKVKQIANGIDISRFANTGHDMRKDFNISRDATVIGTIARLTSEKGLSNLLYAAMDVLKLSSNVIFIIIGDGPQRKQLEELSIELGINSKIIFTGTRSDISGLLSMMDIFVLPSLKEGLPMVLLEAMAAKKPVVATRVGAIPNVITNGLEGLLIDPGDIKGLENAIMKLLNDEDLIRKLSSMAFDNVSKRFTSRVMCERYLETYNEVLHND